MLPPTQRRTLSSPNLCACQTVESLSAPPVPPGRVWSHMVDISGAVVVGVSALATPLAVLAMDRWARKSSVYLHCEPDPPTNSDRQDPIAEDPVGLVGHRCQCQVSPATTSSPTPRTESEPSGTPKLPAVADNDPPPVSAAELIRMRREQREVGADLPLPRSEMPRKPPSLYASPLPAPMPQSKTRLPGSPRLNSQRGMINESKILRSSAGCGSRLVAQTTV